MAEVIETDELLPDWDGDMRVSVHLTEWDSQLWDPALKRKVTVPRKDVCVFRGNTQVASGTASEWDLAIAYANWIVEHPEWTDWLVTADWKNEPWDLIFETIEGHEPWLTDELYAKYLPDSPPRLYCECCVEYHEIKCPQEKR